LERALSPHRPRQSLGRPVRNRWSPLHQSPAGPLVTPHQGRRPQPDRPTKFLQRNPGSRYSLHPLWPFDARRLLAALTIYSLLMRPLHPLFHGKAALCATINAGFIAASKPGLPQGGRCHKARTLCKSYDLHE
jgi:hypothetical protein